MTQDCDDGNGREITARFTRDDLVRGWRERSPRPLRCKPVVRFGMRTDLGRVRENNEDKAEFYEPQDHTTLAWRGSLYAVADGMGGHAAGQIASEMALKSFVAAYYDNATDEIPNALLEAARAANEQVHAAAARFTTRSGMGTTITVAVLAEDRAYITQVGDSRAYLLRDGAVRQVTNDHSWVAEQVRMGGLTPEQAEEHPYRNIITRSIGTQPEVEADVFIEALHPGDVWVLCTDGLTGHVDDATIQAVAGEQAPSEAARQLVELALAAGGRDNITVFVLSVEEVATGPDGEEDASDALAAPEPDEGDETADAARGQGGLRRLLRRGR